MSDDKSSATPTPRMAMSITQMNPKDREKFLEELDFPFCDEVTKYEKMAKIGQGTFGEVFKARHKKNKNLVALKKVLMENEKEGVCGLTCWCLWMNRLLKPTCLFLDFSSPSQPWGRSVSCSCWSMRMWSISLRSVEPKSLSRTSSSLPSTWCSTSANMIWPACCLMPMSNSAWER